MYMYGAGLRMKAVLLRYVEYLFGYFVCGETEDGETFCAPPMTWTHLIDDHKKSSFRKSEIISELHILLVGFGFIVLLPRNT